MTSGAPDVIIKTVKEQTTQGGNDMNRYYDELGCSENLRKIAEENGFEITKTVRNRGGYCFTYSLVNEEREIEIGVYYNVDGMHKMDEKEVIDEILNGPVSYCKEYENLMMGIAK